MVQELQQFIEKHRLSQLQCAQVLELSKFTLNRWLKGKHLPIKTNQKYVKMKMEEFEIKLLTLRNKQDTI